jgi:hypothetical protein
MGMISIVMEAAVPKGLAGFAELLPTVVNISSWDTAFIQPYVISKLKSH